MFKATAFTGHPPRELRLREPESCSTGATRKAKDKRCTLHPKLTRAREKEQGEKKKKK